MSFLKCTVGDKRNEKGKKAYGKITNYWRNKYAIGVQEGPVNAKEEESLFPEIVTGKFTNQENRKILVYERQESPVKLKSTKSTSQWYNQANSHSWKKSPKAIRNKKEHRGDKILLTVHFSAETYGLGVLWGFHGNGEKENTCQRSPTKLFCKKRTDNDIPRLKLSVCLDLL